MESWLQQVSWAIALGVLLSPPCLAQEDSKPLVDVRFDAPYRQIASSLGDEWAPTWGADDRLYTASDDSTSFGGVPRDGKSFSSFQATPENPVAFGVLEGHDPYRLNARSLNSMSGFVEAPTWGPEGASWISLGSYHAEGALYRFEHCAAGAASSATCLSVSRDRGRTWSAAQRQPLFPEGAFRMPSFVALRDDVELTLGNLRDYVYAVFSLGVVNGEDSYVLGRVVTHKLAQARRSDWTFLQRDVSWTADAVSAAPVTNLYGIGPDAGNWKVTNTYSIQGVLYAFVARCTYPLQSADPSGRHVFQNSSVIKSSDGGRTWVRTPEDNYARPMFPGPRFGAPYFVWYGKDGAASLDNADRYVYAVSNDGHFENGDDYILGRVLREKLPVLSSEDWSFYGGGDGLRDSAWTSQLSEARPILANPGRAGMTGVTFIEALRRYVMVSWYYHQRNFGAGMQANDLGTVLEFFEAPKPWGPWSQVKTFETGHLGWYTPIIGQRFQQSIRPGRVTAFLYATGYSMKPEGGLDYSRYKLNYMPITLSTEPLQQKDPAFVGGH